jgi:alpha-galactosidase
MKRVRLIQPLYLIYCLVLILQIFVFYGFANLEISQIEDSEHKISFNSSTYVYIEKLVDGQFIGGYESLESKSPAQPAFNIEILLQPDQKKAYQLINGWKWISAQELAKKDKSNRHFVVELSNTIHPVDIKVHTLFDGTAVITRWLEITNRANKSIALTDVSPWSGSILFAEGNLDIGHQSDNIAIRDFEGVGKHLYNIGWFKWHQLPIGTTKVESLRGNGEDDPFFIIRNKSQKKYLIGHLAWSANWGLDIDRKDAAVSFNIGPIAKDVLRVISPGETIKTPALHLAVIEGNFDTAVQSMHEHIRRTVIPPRKPDRSYLIQYVVSGGSGNFYESVADHAVSIGAELVIFDCGWWYTYGQWYPRKDTYPNGLKPAIEYTHKNGLLFGLYAEVEGGRGNWDQSKVFQEHPDWFVGGPEINTLDLSRDEVAEYVKSELAGIIERYGPDLYRHDWCLGVPSCRTCEGVSAMRDGFLENHYWRYYDNYYAIYDEILAKNPELILQMCSCGGLREDLGMMGHVHETYTVEGDVARIFRSYSGKTVALPPEVIVMGMGVNNMQHDNVPRDKLDTLLRAAYTVSTPWILMVEQDTRENMTDDVRQRYLHYSNIYKNFIRPLWPTCKVYHHAPVNEDSAIDLSPWFAMEYAAPDKTKAWATFVKLGETESKTYLFKPGGLDKDKSYMVTFDSRGETREITGKELMSKGITISLENVYDSELLLFKAI